MNLLTNSTVKYLPLSTSRSSVVKRLLLANSALYGFYLLAPGPQKLNYERNFTAAPNSNLESLAFFHFAHTSLSQFIFTSAVFYTIGNYHVAAYGAASFLQIFGLSALGGSVLTALG